MEEISLSEPEVQSSLSKYFQKYSQKVIIKLDNKEPFLEIMRNRLRDVINKTKEKTVVNESHIICQNSHVDFETNLRNLKQKLFKTK